MGAKNGRFEPLADKAAPCVLHYGIGKCMSERSMAVESVHVQFSSVPGTQAAMGWAGKHCIIADRPEGKAGGMGLGFNGAQMLSLAIGTCFCNDLNYIADRSGKKIEMLVINVALQLDGDPIMAVAADISVRCRMQDGSDGTKLVEEARHSSMVSNSLARGVPVSVAMSE